MVENFLFPDGVEGRCAIQLVFDRRNLSRDERERSLEECGVEDGSIVFAVSAKESETGSSDPFLGRHSGTTLGLPTGSKMEPKEEEPNIPESGAA